MSWMKTLAPALFIGLIAVGQPATGQLNERAHSENNPLINDLLIVDTLLTTKCSPAAACGEGAFWTSLENERPFDLIDGDCKATAIECCPFCDEGVVVSGEIGTGCGGSCCSDQADLKSCGNCCSGGLNCCDSNEEDSDCCSTAETIPPQCAPNDSTCRPQADQTVCGCTECVSNSECNAEMEALTTDKHYAMAEMVEAALRSAETKPQAMRTLINAMALIERQTQIELKAEVAQLQLVHEREIAELRGKLLQSSARMVAQGDSDERLKNWLGPIYTNLNQNMQQLSLVAEDANAITKSMNRLEQKMSNSKRERDNNPNHVSNPYFSERFDNRVNNSREEVFQLQSRVKHLEQQLKNRVANNIQSDQHVQPAKHLQPIYKNEVLNPRYDSNRQPNRSQHNTQLQSNPIREGMQPSRRPLRSSPQQGESLRNR